MVSAQSTRVVNNARRRRVVAWPVILAAGVLLASPTPAVGQQSTEPQLMQLTLERMVELALSNSYRVRQLNLGIERTQLRLRAERARLRSRVDLDISAPDFRSISETRWNSDIGRNEIAYENSRRLEAELSIRQPVILLGYPTNGYLSLNNRVYRYSQIETDGERDLRYYNRYFVRYTQPLFQPNELKNDIEEAELDLEDTELEFYDDVIGIVDDISDDYYGLFQEAYGEVINQAHVTNLEEAETAALEAVAADSSRSLELSQIRVELANAREQLQQSRSQFRLEASSLKARLNLPETDSIALDPVMEIGRVQIDAEQAVQFAMQLAPRMRQLDINFRENELRLEQTKGRGGFQLDLSVSYGREMQDPRFESLWSEPSNTYTLDVNGSLPIWDWGERRSRIESSEIALRQTELRIEEATAQIRAQVDNNVRNVVEFQGRALAMEENLSLAADLSLESLDRYRAGEIGVLDLLQSFRRELDTAENLLDAFLGWRRAILRLQQLTFYDFERGTPALERFGVGATDGPQ